ncbi:MAG: HlyD family efflux transporter periplasmic adaptor subunit [Archangiaceae bacterium]|nr:HlyD family efflux transporter periplasmic adaptor subunit [Archangiaceae bacterium]
MIAPELRHDLEFHRQTGEAGVEVLVVDPVLNAYHKLDELQFELARLFDGRRTLAAISQRAAQQFGVEIPLADLKQFLAQLRALNLLTVASEAVTSRVNLRIARRVFARLDELGVVFAQRRGGAQAPEGGERRGREEEARLIDAALFQLEKGRVGEAARALEAVGQLSKGNARAAMLLKLVQQETLRERRPRDGMWMYRISLGSPDRLLESTARALPFLKWPAVHWAAGVMMVVGVYLALTQLLRLDAAFKALFNFSWLASPVLVAAVYAYQLPSALIHEMFHGLATKFYGGRVREAGVLFSYLSPAAFCDVSDSYRFQSRWARAMVLLAGPICEGLLFSFWSIVMYLNPGASLVGTVAAFLAMRHVFSAAGCINPLIRNDGYYALVEVVGIPNLRERAFRYASGLVGRVLGLPIEQPETSAYERRVFFWYALPAVAMTGIVIYVALEYFYSLAVDAWRGAGFVLFWGALLLSQLGLLTTFWGWLKRWRRELYASRVVRAGAALAVALLAASLVVRTPMRVTGATRVVAKDRRAIVALFDGQLLEVLKEEGDSVEEGEVLARFDARALEVKVRVAEAQLENVRSALQTLEQGARAEEIALSRAAVRESRAQLSFASAARERGRALGAELNTRADSDRLQGIELQVQGELKNRAAALQVLLARPREEAVEALAAEVKRATAELELANADLEVATVKSPLKGRVIKRLGRRGDPMVGARVATGTELMVVARSGVWAEIEVPAWQPQALLEVGQRVKVKFWADPGRSSEARVVAVAPRADASGALTVRAALEAGGDGLPEGAVGEARVLVGEQTLMYQLTYPVRRYLSVDFWRLF